MIATPKAETEASPVRLMRIGLYFSRVFGWGRGINVRLERRLDNRQLLIQRPAPPRLAPNDLHAASPSD